MPRIKPRLALTGAALAAVALSIPVAAAAGWFGVGEQLPPANAKPLSVIIKALEDGGNRQIEHVEFEHGVWEVEVHRDGREIKLHIDPTSGAVVSR